MDFDLSATRRAWIPVKWPGLIQRQGEDLATSVEFEVQLEIEIVDTDEIKALFPHLFGLDDAIKPTEDAIFERLVKNWRVKNKGRDAPFTAANKAKLVRTPMFGNSFANSYIAAVGGVTAIREGNSESSQAGGRADDQSAGTTTQSSPETASVST